MTSNARRSALCVSVLTLALGGCSAAGPAGAGDGDPGGGGDPGGDPLVGAGDLEPGPDLDPGGDSAPGDEAETGDAAGAGGSGGDAAGSDPGLVLPAPDLDRDSVPDADDNCPAVINRAQQDADGDGSGNVCDNCPFVDNADQEDCDADRDGDACDPECPCCPPEVDVDGDGAADAVDNCPDLANPGLDDGDDDGVGDACDLCPGAADPAQADGDRDGAGDVCDLCPAVGDPGQQDLDSDGVGDACDNCPGEDNAGQVDLDGDGEGDACDCGDGVCDDAEDRVYCPDDCAACGDSVCDVDEDPTSCPTDCFMTLSPEDPVIDLGLGPALPLSFTARLGAADVTAQATWSFEPPRLGSIDGPGVLLPSGAAGTGTVRAAYAGFESSATVALRLAAVVDPGSLAASFGPTQGPDPSLAIAYPPDGTVFPANVTPPEVQWWGGSAGNAYRLRWRLRDADVIEYFTAPPTSTHMVPDAVWRAVTGSAHGAQGDPLQMTLQRHSGGATYEPVSSTLHLAQGALAGAVYYNRVPDNCGTFGNVHVVRVLPSRPGLEGPFVEGGTCYGCHAVSRDGRTLLAGFDLGSPFPFATFDLTSSPPAPAGITTSTGLAGSFGAFHPDGTKVLLSSDGNFSGGGGTLVIASTLDGAVLNPDVLGGMCGEPAWSPDGAAIAAICNLSSVSWIFDASGGDLVVADVAPDGFTVSNQRVLVPQLSWPRPSYPSFSPDSRFLAFARASAGSRSIADGSLWLVDVADGNTVKQLTAAGSPNGFYPVFAPARAGGYYWIALVSRRDYGNRLVGANRQQVWIAAIDDPPAAPDPSHPGFYLLGQEACDKSENPVFARLPCLASGDGCEQGIDCCSGHCASGAGGARVCGTAAACAEPFNACAQDGDCCTAGASCLDGWCVPPFEP